MKTNKNKVTTLISQFSKIIVITILTGQAIVACQSDDSVNDTIISDPTTVSLKTISGNDINMDGIWSSGCLEANNNKILNESLNFNNENLQIDIKEYDNLQCNGATVFNQAIIITFNNSGTTTVQFNGNQVIVNKIDGTATYSDGQVDVFKQVFLIDDTGNNLYMHHALFGNDGGELNDEGYPTEIIPIPITKTN